MSEPKIAEARDTAPPSPPPATRRPPDVRFALRLIMQQGEGSSPPVCPDAARSDR